MIAALYARYSSDQQRDASIADQLRDCRAFATRQGWTIRQEFSDAAMSGATILRPGFQALMRDALAGAFDVVLAESLDRFSRDQEDTAGLFKRLSFAGVRIVTLSEGEIGHLHVGLKGTMNALYLKELADKTRRGLRGRVEAGRSGGGLCYGYTVTRTFDGDEIERGGREVNQGEANVVRRIFREYADGMSPQAIGKRLNAEGISGPGGNTWGPSTLHGQAKRGTGVLNNELYLGRMVWNKLRYMKDPDTGRRVSRVNPRSEWVVVDVPDLRIVSDDLWTTVKKRQEQMRQLVSETGNPQRALRPLHLFSGLVKCGECGRSYVIQSAHRMGCSGYKERGICTNTLTMRRDELEARVLNALERRFFQSGRFELFCQEFTAAVNEARMEIRGNAAAAARELTQIEKHIRELIGYIKEGTAGAWVRGELLDLEDRHNRLTKQREVAAALPPLLHPNMADRFQVEITELRQALSTDRHDTVAREAARSMVEEIRLTPRDGVLAVDVKGNLAAMLSAADPKTDWPLQMALVAGGGFEPPTFGL